MGSTQHGATKPSSLAVRTTVVFGSVRTSTMQLQDWTSAVAIQFSGIGAVSVRFHHGSPHGAKPKGKSWRRLWQVSGSGRRETSPIRKLNHRRKSPHILDKSCEQRGVIVVPPDQSKGQRQLQISYRYQRHVLRTSPTRGTADKRHAESTRHEAQNRRLIQAFLNDARRFQATAKTRVHQAVVEKGTLPPRKPDEGSTAQVPQAKRLCLGHRMAFRHCEHQVDQCNIKLRQFAIYVADGKQESGSSCPDRTA